MYYKTKHARKFRAQFLLNAVRHLNDSIESGNGRFEIACKSAIILLDTAALGPGYVTNEQYANMGCNDPDEEYRY